MAVIGVQVKKGNIVLTVARGGYPVEDLLFVPTPHNQLFTCPEDLLTDASRISECVQMDPETAIALSDLLVAEVEKIYGSE